MNPPRMLGGVIPDWLLLADWNRWCLASGARFFVWQPERGTLSVCDEHRHRVVLLADEAMDQLPPFHPGCRCGVLPRLD